MYNGTWQGPSFAPRMKVHPCSMMGSLRSHSPVYTFLSLPHAFVSAPRFRVPAGLQAGNLPCKWQKKRKSRHLGGIFRTLPVGGCALPASPGGVRIPGAAGTWRVRSNQSNHRARSPSVLRARLQLENCVNKAAVFTVITINNLLLPPGAPPGAAASRQ